MKNKVKFPTQLTVHILLRHRWFRCIGCRRRRSRYSTVIGGHSRSMFSDSPIDNGRVHCSILVVFRRNSIHQRGRRWLLFVLLCCRRGSCDGSILHPVPIAGLEDLLVSRFHGRWQNALRLLSAAGAVLLLLLVIVVVLDVVVPLEVVDDADDVAAVVVHDAYVALPDLLVVVVRRQRWQWG